MELTALSLTEAAKLIEKGEISPLALTEAHLARIEEVDRQLNCFITVTPEAALGSARRAEEAIQKGGYLGPLHGIPLALKDLYETAGVRTTAGSKVFRDHVPEKDCTAWEKLEAAGAINLGKLNMHEIALGVTNNNPHFGACRNPWDPARSPGGSSGGSGAALAAGLCLGSLGSDTGGSIRIPASLCGVVGLKPTYGRVSLRGVIPLSWNLDHAGPMARRVEDVVVLLEAIAGYDPRDPYCANIPAPDFVRHLDGDVRGWRVAVARDEFFDRADGQVLEAVGEAAKTFAALGAKVAEVGFPGAYEAARANGLMTPADAAAFHRERLAERPQDFGPDVRQRLETGAAYSSTEYILARRAQTTLRRRFEEFFKRYDVLLTPTTPIAAPLLEGPDAVEQARRLTRFTAPFNLTGLPALSVPCGFTREGLPVGLQIVAGPWAEAKVLNAGLGYEREAGWHRFRPEKKV